MAFENPSNTLVRNVGIRKSVDAGSRHVRKEPSAISRRKAQKLHILIQYIVRLPIILAIQTRDLNTRIRRQSQGRDFNVAFRNRALGVRLGDVKTVCVPPFCFAE